MRDPKPQLSGLISSLHGSFGHINLGSTEFTIGRASDNQLVLDDLQVSSYHAKIYLTGARYSIVDLDSLNGTFVSDRRLTPNTPYSLHPNERIRFGQNANNAGVIFTYEVTGLESAAPTRVAPPLSQASRAAAQVHEAQLPVKPTARTRPAIRDIIAGQTDYKPSSGMSSKELADLIAPLTALTSNSLFIYMKVAEVLVKAIGGKAINRLKKVFPGPYEYTAIVLAFALAFRKTEQEVISLYDTASGSVIEGKLPKNLRSFGEGTITFEFIDESPTRIIVDATIEIKGQDWGKSKRALEVVFECGEEYIRKITGVGRKD
jgi:pSer/pThr/pTyr-binding forkhead associated (FHA) protein